MSNHQNKYKKRPALYEDTNTGRLVRAGKQEERRKATRAETFSRHRGVPETQETQPSRTSDASARYRRWKVEKELKKKIEQQKKKPIFKVGIVHHKLYSPPISSKAKTVPQPCGCRVLRKVTHQPSPQKRITRATQKRLDEKLAAAAATPAVASTSKDSSTAKKSSKGTRKKCLAAAKENLKPSFAPSDYTFKAPSGITGLPLFGRIAFPDDLDVANTKPWPVGINSLPAAETPGKRGTRLTRQLATEDYSPESPEAIHLRLSADNESAEEENVGSQSPSKVPSVASTEVEQETNSRSDSPVPASFSPYIVTSRGKNSARKEQKTRMGIRRSSVNEIPTKETVMQSLNISVQEEEQTAQYFKHILQSETDKLNELCAKWEAIKSDPDLSEDAEYDINAAIGQSKLLMKKKFERFRNLIHDCETGKGQMLVRCKDLGGFWDLIDREVKNLEARFSKLETLKSNGWKEEEAEVKKVTKKKAAPAKVKINAKSSARSWILAARRKMSQNEEDGTDLVIAEKKSVEEEPSTSRIATSPKHNERRRSTPKTPTSLLKKVQLSEASRNVKSPLALMKISQMCKTPEVKLDDSITYVNSDQTPAKSILKKSDVSSGSESGLTKSSRKVVDFDDKVFAEEVPTEEVDAALQNSIDLGQALARIESYDLDDDVFAEEVPSDKVDEALENSTGLSRALARIESYESDNDFVQPFNVPNNVTVRRIDKRLDFEDETFDETENTHTAESATIVASNPEPSSVPDIIVVSPSPIKPTPTKTPSKPKNADSTKRRKSTRKSVRFNPDDCTACGEMAKPAKPKTPHVRRSKRLSLLANSERQSVGSLPIGSDLISFDSPKKTHRTRRSTCK